MEKNEKLTYGRAPSKSKYYNDYWQYTKDRIGTKHYNEFYGYDDIELWRDEAWEGHDSPMACILEALSTDCRKYREAHPIPNYYPNRHDAHSSFASRCDFFDDVVDMWREKGLVFSCSGMMHIVMAPVSVQEHRKSDPEIIWIPDFVDLSNPHYAMDLITEYAPLLERCAKEEIMVQFLAYPLVGKANPMQEKGLETQGNFMIDMHSVRLDISKILGVGKKLEDIPGCDAALFGPVESFEGCALVDVSRLWQGRMGHQYFISKLYLDNMPEWDMERHIRSAQGRLQAEGMRLEHDYDGPNDPRLIAKWDKMGLKYENHYQGTNWWFTLTPKSAFVHPEHKLPVLCVMKESRTAIPFMTQTALQFYYNFIEMAARGEYMMVFFALETPDDNELLVDILKQTEAQYPVDSSRIYITGQSHNGYYALEFYRRHPDMIAAAATLCDPFGLQVGATVDWKDIPNVEETFEAQDMPLIDICGQLENQYFNTPRGAERELLNAELYRRRLKAFRCPDRSVEEILACRDSSDYATRINGIPADRTEVGYYMGNECYISDVKNMDGKWHLRFVSLENMPHMIAPQMAELSWSFMRRFARNRETGETIELY
ncbi:MAG: hypothetical protein ACI4PO_07375 [Faecousia sp.]